MARTELCLRLREKLYEYLELYILLETGSRNKQF